MSGSASRPGPFLFADLGARVHPRVDPSRYAAELDGLYSSLFATVDWFETHDMPEWMGACILEKPRHVLLFTGKGATVEILNKTFDIAPEDARRAGQALFRAFPHVRRIHFEVMFAPSTLALPSRVLHHTDHMVIELPETEEEYAASLGRSRHLRSYQNRLRRDFSEVATKTMPVDERAPALLRQLVQWKEASFHARGKQTYWETHPQVARNLQALLRRRGEIRLTSIDGEMAALSFNFPVGTSVCAQQAAVQPGFDRYGLSLLAIYWDVCDAISRGFRSFNLLWGNEEFKSRLGARPHRATPLSVYPNQRSRLWSLDEEWQVARRQAPDVYWQARRRAGHMLRSLGADRS